MNTFRLLRHDVVAGLVAAALGLSAASLLAIGISGAVAAGLGSTLGRAFVAGDAFGITYTKKRFSDYFEYEPRADSCEVVGYRLSAGVLGLVPLAGWLLLRGRAPHGVLPAGLTATVGATMFGIVAGGFCCVSSTCQNSRLPGLLRITALSLDVC